MESVTQRAPDSYQDAAPPVEFLRSLRGDKHYIPAARRWYGGEYLWDRLHYVQFLAAHDATDDAVLELRGVLANQREDGFIPNWVRDPNNTRINPEQWLTFRKPYKARATSEYTQPLLMASGMMEIVRAYDRKDHGDQGLEVLQELWPSLVSSYDYIKTNRQNSEEDLLVGIIKPEECGRDSGSEFDKFKFRLPRNGLDTPAWVDKVNPALDYMSALAIGLRHRLDGWDLSKLRRRFWVNDVMFNCLLAYNIEMMGELAEKLELYDQSAAYKEWALNLEQQIIGSMWQPDAVNGKGFYALDNTERKHQSIAPGVQLIRDSMGIVDPEQQKHIDEVTISNPFAILLPALSEEHLEAILDMLDSSFNTPYPLPSNSTRSRNYDPHFSEKPIMWRGPVWQWMNHWIANGCEMQATRADLSTQTRQRCADWANRVRESSAHLTKDEFRENYNPITGEGLRVRDFGGSVIGYLGGITIQHSQRFRTVPEVVQ